jgi:hypothetical protein
MKIIGASFQRTVILCLKAHVKGPPFWSWNVQIHWALT